MTDRELVDKALEARSGSYSPYSKYRVGAALIAQNDSGEEKVFCGANVENASYPCGVCAERVAVPKAVFEGFRNIKTLAVVGSSDVICTPCGMCRQFLNEFNPKLRILCAGSGGNYEEHVLDELLPFGFGPENM
ncbi:MAG: cytidine deaminase [Treponema sp.]|nr:cytidine deaminase [Treponema sp.]MBR6913841.1 cytidine deaminase [Treponema sp.]